MGTRISKTKVEKYKRTPSFERKISPGDREVEPEKLDPDKIPDIPSESSDEEPQQIELLEPFFLERTPPEKVFENLSEGMALDLRDRGNEIEAVDGSEVVGRVPSRLEDRIRELMNQYSVKARILSLDNQKVLVGIYKSNRLLET